MWLGSFLARDGDPAGKVAVIGVDARGLDRAHGRRRVRLSFEAVFASVTTVRGAGPDVGATARMAADSMLSWLKEFDGYCGLVILTSAETGSARFVTLWEDLDALERSERGRAAVRESMIATAGAELESVERSEVVLDERVDSGPARA
jgi:hypothetical protein